MGYPSDVSGATSTLVAMQAWSTYVPTGFKVARIIDIIVLIVVLLALGATIVLGAIAFCHLHGYSNLVAVVTINPFQARVGCS